MWGVSRLLATLIWRISDHSVAADRAAASVVESRSVADDNCSIAEQLLWLQNAISSGTCFRSFSVRGVVPVLRDGATSAITCSLIQLDDSQCSGGGRGIHNDIRSDEVQKHDNCTILKCYYNRRSCTENPWNTEECSRVYPQCCMLPGPKGATENARWGTILQGSRT